MKLALIRHFQTPGNLEGRYIGITDEDLIPLKALNQSTSYPQVERVYVSPLKRCIQTASLIYPEQKLRIKKEFRECNFGQFENKNYKELQTNPKYQEWVDSEGKLPFPDGENPKQFRERCCKTFLDCVEECLEQGVESVAFVIHGGTIMSILEAYDMEQKGFYDYQVKNGQGFLLSLEEMSWQKGNHILKNRSFIGKEICN